MAWLAVHRSSVPARSSNGEQTRSNHDPQGWNRSSLSVRSQAESLTGSIYASTILSIEQDEDRGRQKLNDQQWVLQASLLISKYCQF